MKLFLIDGHALVFKMYYAFLGRPMVNSKGVDTSILFGFTKYLLELIAREQPTHIAVSFDPPGGTFRNEMYPQYKANRGETPQLVIDALQPLTRIVRSLNIPVVMIPGFEADDVIGSMAKRFAREGMEVYMVTPDKDYGQLVETSIFQYKPGKSGTENEILGISEICQKWNISSPLQVIDILALCGDSSDNVPGVDGVGPVGAAKLLAKYSSVENIYQHLEELTDKQRQMFINAQDHIALSKELVTIKTDIQVDVTEPQMRLNTAYGSEWWNIIEEFEFQSLKRFTKEIPAEVAPKEVTTVEYKVVPPSQIASDSISVIRFGSDYYVAAGKNVASGNASEFKAVFENEMVTKFGFDLKSIMNSLSAEGIGLNGELMDIELMHYVINPERSHKLDILAKSYLGVNLETPQDQTREVSLFDEPEDEKDTEKHYLEAVVTGMLGKPIKDELKNNGQYELYTDIEQPLIGVLSRMETAGVKVDLSSLSQFAQELKKEMLGHEAFVRELAADPQLNVASPKQIGELIFEKLKLDPKAKKPAKGSWPTDEETLLALADRSPVIDAILEYRGTRKLLSTYIEPFGQYLSPVDGRVHTTFNQALTSTGRLSSSNPNLQNIPIRTEQGRKIREAFVPGATDSVMMSADYSQIELRIMAHLSCDQHLINAFNSGQDVHAATAAKIFGIDVNEVTADQRRIAKTANFGIMYGISAFGLSQRLRCSRTEAKKIIDDYFESFPSIRSFINDTLCSARETGYVQTIFGRRRYIPDINSHNANVRAFAERNAVNAPIQGSSADIIKLAMIGVDRRLLQDGLKARMVLQIHDELLLEVPENEIEKVKSIVVEEMEQVVKLSIPLSVECNYGRTWLEAH